MTLNEIPNNGTLIDDTVNSITNMTADYALNIGDAQPIKPRNYYIDVTTDSNNHGIVFNDTASSGETIRLLTEEGNNYISYFKNIIEMK